MNRLGYDKPNNIVQENPHHPPHYPQTQKQGIISMVDLGLISGFSNFSMDLIENGANMYEFSISGAFLILLIYLTALKIRDLRFIATFISGFALVIIFAAVSLFYVEVQTVMPALQSYWLVIHVVVAIMATGFFSVAAGLHIFYLLKASGKAKALFDRFPTLVQMERVAYRFNVVGFVLWSFTLIAGAIWAERAWHRYWGWDTKEVWTFIIWVLYAGYLHAMATRGWTGKRAAWLGLVAFLSVIFNFTIVNLFFKGLHVYSGL